MAQQTKTTMSHSTTQKTKGTLSAVTRRAQSTPLASKKGTQLKFLQNKKDQASKHRQLTPSPVVHLAYTISKGVALIQAE